MTYIKKLTVYIESMVINMSFVKRTNIQGLLESEYGKYAVKQTGVDFPNCFTYATARVAEIRDKCEPIDSVRVVGAQDLWSKHASYFQISNYAKKGALMIWQYGQYGHVAVVEDIIDTNTIAWSQSNYGGNLFDYVQGNPNGYCGMNFLGYLIYDGCDNEVTTPSQVVSGIIKEQGTATFLVDSVNVRKGSPTGPVVAQYNKGQSVKYWGKYVGNGHRYVVYTGASGNTNFIAVSGSETYGKDKWAECK